MKTEESPIGREHSAQSKSYVDSKAPNEQAVTASQNLLHQVWNNLVRRYTGCNLTYRSDTLVAIHGITCWLSELSGSRNIAELWIDCIAIELLWISGSALYHSHDAPRKEVLTPAMYHAPSWSWASSENEISFLIHRDFLNGGWVHNWNNIKIEIALKDARSDTKINGQVTYTHLIITVHVRPITQETICSPRIPNAGSKTAQNSPGGIPPDQYSWDQLPTQCSDRNVWGLLVVSIKISWLPCSNSDAWVMLDAGLLLEKIENTDGTPTFRRMGICRQHYGQDDTPTMFADRASS